MAGGKLRKLFTNEEVLLAYEQSGNNKQKASEKLTELGRGTITHQTFGYWMKHLNKKKANGEPYVGTTVLDREIRESTPLRSPSIDDDNRVESAKEDNSRILVIPDQHAPYQHPDALEFLAAVAARFRPTRVVNLGDETDGHALSMHDSDPSLDSAGAELANARIFLHSLERMFPVMDIMHSNHGSLIYRRAFKSGIPAEYIKSYREILFPEGGGEGWEWTEKLKIKLPNGESCIFQHQSSGDILNNAGHERCSIVEGHSHGQFEIRYRASSEFLYFGMTSGCLVDNSALAFAYGKLFPRKPVIGCSVIIDSLPQLIPMRLDKEGRWIGVL